MTIGEKIKFQRELNGLTQKQLGEKCGMADSAIRRYELEKANPKIETLQKIANGLGVSISQLYPLHGELYIDSTMRKIEKIARNYGYDAQSRQCIEEMAELTQAINKFWRNQLKRGDIDLDNVPFGTPEENNIEEELADVQIVLWEMKYLHKISDSDFRKSIERKLNRQLARMEEENAD